MLHAGLPRYLGLTSGRSVSIKVNKTRKHFFRNTHGACMFPRGKHLFSVFVSKMQTMNFNQNPSMRAFAKILRARASEHSSNFYEKFEQRPSFASTTPSREFIFIPLLRSTGQQKARCCRDDQELSGVENFTFGRFPVYRLHSPQEWNKQDWVNSFFTFYILHSQVNLVQPDVGKNYCVTIKWRTRSVWG